MTGTELRPGLSQVERFGGKSVHMSGMSQAMSKGISGVVPELKEKHGGGWLVASLHIVTAVIGAGVLALPNALGTLGWIAGPICILGFFVVAYVASQMLASLYDYDGKHHGRYQEAVLYILGPRHELACAIVQNFNLVSLAIAYTITAATSMQALANIACGITDHATTANTENFENPDSCFNQQWAMSLIFGGVQLIASQYPNLEEAWLMSAVGAIASFGYSIIALGLSIWQVTEGHHHGTISGIPADPVDKAFNILNALGSIAFAYAFTVILLEIADTVKEPPRAVTSMHKAVKAGLGVSLSFYMSVAVFGYLALGSAVPTDIIVGFGEPNWAVGLAQCFVLLHMVGAYQVFAQPFFVTLERRIFLWMKIPQLIEQEERAGSLTASQFAAAAKTVTASAASAKAMEAAMSGAMSGAVSGMSALTSAQIVAERQQSTSPYRETSMLRLPMPTDDIGKTSRVRRYMLSVVIRCLFVVFTTVVAMVLPFFGSIVGLIGAVTFWPLSIYFPFTMYKKVVNLPKWKQKTMDGVAAFMLLVAVAAAVGAVKNIISSFQDFTIF